MDIENNWNFLKDEEKMADFRILTKAEFLNSYSYLSEEEYDNTFRLYALAHNNMLTDNFITTECANCGHIFDVDSISKDEMGWHTTCPVCKSSFNVDVTPIVFHNIDNKTELDLREVVRKDKWKKYINYLKEWIEVHSDPMSEGMSPACYDEFCDNEYAYTNGNI